MRILNPIAKYMGYASGILVACLMFLTVADIIGRDFFNAPLTGGIEICSLMLAMMVALRLAEAALERSHIKVDLVMDRLPKRAQFTIDNAILIVTLIFLVILTWTNFIEAIHTQYTTSILMVPRRPFHLVFSVGLGVFCICTLALIIENFRKRGKGGS